MSVKIFDTMTTATPNFPLAYAEKINIVKEDGSEADIQTLYNNGELGGGDTSLTVTEAEYLALPEEERLNNSYYLYDIGVHYKNGVAYSRKKPIQLTMEEYKALGEVDPDQEYIVSADAEGILLEASDIGYSNAVSNLPCTTVQGAIDELSSNLGEKADKSYVDDNFATMDKITQPIGFKTSLLNQCWGYYTKSGKTISVHMKFVLSNALSDWQPINNTKLPTPSSALTKSANGKTGATNSVYIYVDGAMSQAGGGGMPAGTYEFDFDYTTV